MNIGRFEEGVVGKNFLVRGTGREQFQQVHDTKSHPANTGTTAALIGIDGNAIKVLRCDILTFWLDLFQRLS